MTDAELGKAVRRLVAGMKGGHLSIDEHPIITKDLEHFFTPDGAIFIRDAAHRQLAARVTELEGQVEALREALDDIAHGCAMPDDDVQRAVHKRARTALAATAPKEGK